MAVALAYLGDKSMAKEAMAQALMILHESGIDGKKVVDAIRIFRKICKTNDKQGRSKHSQQHISISHHYIGGRREKTMLEIARESCEEEPNSTKNMKSLKRMLSKRSTYDEESKVDGFKVKEFQMYDREQFLSLQEATRKNGMVTNAGVQFIAATLVDGMLCQEGAKNKIERTLSLSSKSSMEHRKINPGLSFRGILNLSLEDELDASVSDVLSD